MLNHALEYQNMGLSVIPIGPEKKPLIKWAEFQRRMATAEEIKQWWHQWPSAMVGLVTGQISRLFVVDCDTEEGFQAVQGLIPDSLELPTAQDAKGRVAFLLPEPGKIGKPCGCPSGCGYSGGRRVHHCPSECQWQRQGL